jgi:5'-phosphate synthase pdxT subunit
VDHKIGVLALQGSFREHLTVVHRLGCKAVEIRLPSQLDAVDGLIIPGGESTAIGRLLGTSSLAEAIRGFTGPIFGTCAGMILLARESVDGMAGQPHLGRIDLVVRRNGYGAQRHSFEADVDLLGEGRPVRGVFIRAPRVATAGPGVEVLAVLADEPVLLRQDRVFVAAFHPELTNDTRIHERFLQTVTDRPRTAPHHPRQP